MGRSPVRWSAWFGLLISIKSDLIAPFLHLLVSTEINASESFPVRHPIETHMQQAGMPHSLGQLKLAGAFLDLRQLAGDDRNGHRLFRRREEAELRAFFALQNVPASHNHFVSDGEIL